MLAQVMTDFSQMTGVDYALGMCVAGAIIFVICFVCWQFFKV